MPILTSSSKHLLHCVLLFSSIVIFQIQLVWQVHHDDVNGNSNEDTVTQFDPFKRYGSFITIFLYITRFLALLSLPQCFCNFLGLILYNAFPDKVQLKSSPLMAPFICIRTVTRGDYADLVKNNINRNMKTCLDVGLENFIIEVVTDKPLDIKKHPRIREVVIPSSYSSKTGAMFKARALQYCLEDDNNILGENDWIVHLDEETILTDNVVRGIVNFVSKGKHEFGQGLITYANEEIVNWMTTLADTFRVAEDMGKLRFQFWMFHRPLFGWKGSYVVSKYSAEKDVSYDHGQDGSVAEDCYFSMIAYQKGYTFDFVEGEMWEKSPFSIKDFIQQRKRWLQGIFLVVHSPKINLVNKLFLLMSLYAWMTIPLSTSNIFLAYFVPLPTDSFTFLNVLVAFVGAVSIYLYIFGAVKSFSLVRMGLPKYSLCIVGALITIPFNICIENVAVIWGLMGKKHKFYVVEKRITTDHVV